MRHVLSSLVCGVMLVGMVACGDDAPEAATGADGGATIEVVATDFAFELSPDSVPAGEVETVLINEGKAPHQAGYYKLDEGVTYEDYIDAILEDDSNIPQLSSAPAGHMRPLVKGKRGVRPGDELEPGIYAVLCSIRDPETGKNHYELGMVAPLEVTE